MQAISSTLFLLGPEMTITVMNIGRSLISRDACYPVYRILNDPSAASLK